jgi:glycosyltransferase involved in cell wall biosynthesis
MKIGIPCAGFIGWAGGIDQLRITIESLVALEESDLEVHVIVPDRGSILFVRNIMSRMRVFLSNGLRGKSRALPGKPSTRFIAESLGEERIAAHFHHIDMGARALAALCRKHRLDVLVLSGFPLGPNFPFPWVGYIDDFQYKYYPDYYDPTARAKRDRFMARMVSEPRAVIMLSQAAVHDAERYVSGIRAELTTLPLAAVPAEEWFVERPGVREQYGVGPRYFMISNQFWVSKRHDIAFSAFQRLAQADSEIQLVCTGDTNDHRYPNYFPGLVKFLDAHDLSERVRILGLIPKLDQIALMKNCIATIQPTQFEGTPGGLSICDAISLGAPTIVSDIPVNREIEKWVTRYFPLNNAEALYRAMAEALAQHRPVVPPERLLALSRQRRREYGEALLTLAHRTAASAH